MNAPQSPNPVLHAQDADALAARLAPPDTWLVVLLCAAWCGTCRDYQQPFADLATRHPGMVFVDIDIEDEADLVGDLDIENFPTLHIQRGDTVLFHGTMLPAIGVLERQLKVLQESPLKPMAGPDLRGRLVGR